MRKRLISMLMLIGMLVALVVPMAVPVMAQTASIDQIRFPAPPNFVLNTGADTELFWWKITGLANSTPVKMVHSTRGPGIAGPVFHTEEWDIRGMTLPIFNVENTAADKDAAHGDETTPNFAHSWQVPAGTAPGVYFSRVEYYSEEVSGDPPTEGLFDSASEISFLIEQPWQLFKYNDLNGDGNYDPGEGETGLDGWHFTVSGPGGYAAAGDTSGGGFLVLPNATEAGAYTVTETLQANWVNTDPGDLVPPITKTVNVPGDLPPADPTVRLGNMLLAPDTIVTISANPTSVEDGGGPVTLVVTELNNGQVPLTNVHVDVTSALPAPWDSFTVSKAGPNPAGTAFGGDVGDDDVLSPGELWNWTIPNVMVTATTTFVAIGHGLDPSGADVTYSAEHPFERAEARVDVNPPKQLPASTNTGIAIMVGGFAAVIGLLLYRRTRRSNQSS